MCAVCPENNHLNVFIIKKSRLGVFLNCISDLLGGSVGQPFLIVKSVKTVKILYIQVKTSYMGCLQCDKEL